MNSTNRKRLITNHIHNLYSVAMRDHEINFPRNQLNFYVEKNKTSKHETHVLNLKSCLIFYGMQIITKAVLSLPRGGHQLLVLIWCLILWMIVFNACDINSLTNRCSSSFAPSLVKLAYPKHITFFEVWGMLVCWFWFNKIKTISTRSKIFC